MSDPVRLRDDPAASELLRQDLEVAKQHASVTYDVGVGLAALARKTGDGSSGGGSSGGGSSWKTIGAVSGIAGAGIAVIIAAIVMSRPADAPPSEPPVSEPTPPVTPDARDEPAPEEIAETPEEIAEPQEVVDPEPREVAPPDPLAEARELAEARRSLASDPARTLAIVERHRRTYRPGLYREEREALAILALDRLGRTAAARPRAIRFLARFPSSAFRERIERVAGVPREGSERGRP